ncbi:flagellar basal body P-ring formation chaperone FlgA [Litoreibacter roseus]|uniref:Flagella basal body P-ring formation protein FlgA n=1 Tax=Litoreibacter roseus TaxID=2601869 RepID=A0A6N6JGA4_9RHOB|nr:flagellar basal body P-ring formation chaperone FlgA [Litoreibacter roseus]GFE64409.1 flagella basal body P-ring formation protein FlgA [Litoreibacter roseus]
MRVILLLTAVVASFWGAATLADTVVPTRTIRANTVITAADLKLIPETILGMVEDIGVVAGSEARTNLYVGRPIRPSDIGPPAIVERNQVITIIYLKGGLSIATEGRALDRGGVGDRLKVMNLASRNTVFGRVDQSGAVRVGN